MGKKNPLDCYLESASCYAHWYLSLPVRLGCLPVLFYGQINGQLLAPSPTKSLFPLREEICGVGLASRVSPYLHMFTQVMEQRGMKKEEVPQKEHGPEKKRQDSLRRFVVIPVVCEHLMHS